VPSDQPTIQSAIDVATDGERVLVAPGTYSENINFGGKAITVRSESGPEVTIIDGGNADSVVSFTSGEGRNSVLNGFTLQNGKKGGPDLIPGGGGIRIEGSSPTITNNVIRNNQACSGGGIQISSGSPLIQRNTITGNRNSGCIEISVGGGISISAGSTFAEILDNVISDNIGFDGGGIYLASTGTFVKGNIIKGNHASHGGGGIYIIADALVVQNLITGNQAPFGGGIYWLIHSPLRGPIVVNNTIAGNDGILMGSGIFAEGFDAQTELTNNIIVAKPGQSGLHCGDLDQNPPIIRFNNIFSAGGMAYGGTCSDKTGTNGNISADPLFTDPTQGDYHLNQGSPSIDRGDNLEPNLPETDIDGHLRIWDGDRDFNSTVDMGVYEFGAPPSINISLQDESNGNILKINSTNGQSLFTRCEGIPLIECRLKPAHTPRLYQLAAGKFDAGISKIRYSEGETIRRHLARQSDRTLARGAPSTSF
jgi:hypothetical protein